jgi:hypothetical protein
MVLVLDKQTDWSAEGKSILNARLDLDQVFLVALAKRNKWQSAI